MGHSGYHGNSSILRLQFAIFFPYSVVIYLSCHLNIVTAMVITKD